MNNDTLWNFVRDRFEAVENGIEALHAEIKALRIDLNGRVRTLEGGEERRRGWFDAANIVWAAIVVLIAVGVSVVLHFA